MPPQRSGLFLGIVLILGGLIVGLIVAAGLYQWETTTRAESALAEITPTMSVQLSPDQLAKPSGSPSASPGASAASGPEDGKAVFATSCNGCHPNGGAGVGPALKGVPADTFKQVVRQGRGGMPPFASSRLTDQQLNDIISYVQGGGSTNPAASSAAPAASPATSAAPEGSQAAGGNADAGKSIFATSCNACHPDGGKGLGPAIKGLPADTIKQIVRKGRATMPAFSASQLSDQQLEDIAAFLK